LYPCSFYSVIVFDSSHTIEWRKTWQNENEKALDQFLCSFIGRCLGLPEDDEDPPLLPKVLEFFAQTPSAILFSNTILLQLLRQVSFDTIKDAMQSCNLDADNTLQYLNESIILAENKVTTTTQNIHHLSLSSGVKTASWLLNAVI
jgi:hypothetical protein